MFPDEINFYKTNAKEPSFSPASYHFQLFTFLFFCSNLTPHCCCYAIHDCQIFPFSLTRIFAPHPKYWHQPLALVISMNLLPGATGEVKCYLLHPLFLCSTENSHLLIQVWFDLSYSLSLTTSLFPLTYDLSVVTVIFYFTFFHTIHVQSKYNHSILPLPHFPSSVHVWFLSLSSL